MPTCARPFAVRRLACAFAGPTSGWSTPVANADTVILSESASEGPLIPFTVFRSAAFQAPAALLRGCRTLFARKSCTSGAFARSKQFQGCGFSLGFTSTQPQRCHPEAVCPHVLMRLSARKSWISGAFARQQSRGICFAFPGAPPSQFEGGSLLSRFSVPPNRVPYAHRAGQEEPAVRLSLSSRGNSRACLHARFRAKVVRPRTSLARKCLRAKVMDIRSFRASTKSRDLL